MGNSPLEPANSRPGEVPHVGNSPLGPANLAELMTGRRSRDGRHRARHSVGGRDEVTASRELRRAQELTIRFAQGAGVLIGCDVLGRCLFVYNGRGGTFTLDY